MPGTELGRNNKKRNKVKKRKRKRKATGVTTVSGRMHIFARAYLFEIEGQG